MKKLAVFITTLLVPGIALAQGSQNATILLNKVYALVNQLTYILVAVGILVFIWGIVRYVIAGNEEAKANAQRIILWGVIGLFAIVAVWGLVNFLANTTGIGGNVPSSQLPCPPGAQHGVPTPSGLIVC